MTSPASPAESEHLEQTADGGPASRPTVGAPTPDAVEAVGQAAVLQRALINRGEMVGTKYVFEQTLDSHAPISPEYLAVVREVYAEPHPAGPESSSSFENALGALRPAGSVLVINRPLNCGRTILAYALLARLLDDEVINEARPLSFGGSQHFPTRRLPHDHRCGYLLELPPDEDDFSVADEFGSSLRTISERLHRRNCRLIVLTRPEQWRRISQGAPEGVAPELGSVRPRDVAERWLLAQQPDLVVDQWLDHEDIKPLLLGQSPTDVLSLVYLILEQHRSAQVTTATETDDPEKALKQARTGSASLTFEEQVANVVAARSNWEDALYSWHEPERGSRTSFERNFLLAAAVLRGDPVGHVYAKAAELTEKLDKIDVDVDGQREPGVIAMTRAVGARREGDGALAFSRPHWDDAAIEYFWNDRPLARNTFLDWLAQAPVDTSTSKEALETINKDVRRALAARIGQFALRWAVRHRRQEPLEQIVKAWYKHGTDKELWPLAVELLDNASIHAASAPYIHTMLLGWAGRKEPSLQRAVVEVCTGTFGRRHTSKALRRLRNVAAQGHPDVIDTLREAVCVLWEDTTVRRMLFGYVVEWCGAEKTSQTVGHRTFAALAMNSPSRAEGLPPLLAAVTEASSDDEDTFRPGVRGLVTGWRTLLRQAAGPAGERELDTAVFTWLDAALKLSALKPVVFDTLRQAVNVHGAEGPAFRETLRTCAEWWLQGPGRPYSEQKEDLKRELSASLDKDLIARRHQSPAAAPSGAAGDETRPTNGVDVA
ncbi:hypothetical protein MRQ86_36245 [Streptomyces sp. MMS21 TC-5]|uniref:hypothetical protein n=1 Tax=Streptomyces sp. MMS21 TC-5 TaxID=2925833 RepID=UPI001F60F8FF|nr:hypothetical protein [Streptomyces sp. MMS21 TC-5]MCI4085654.1 hypothetical protein [Streptomyces sp. MMS21 TC-5]